jgi:hypothetical protein
LLSVGRLNLLVLDKITEKEQDSVSAEWLFEGGVSVAEDEWQKR